MWVQVLCFSHESGQFLRCLELEESALPERFERGMGLSLDQEQWYVISAEPAHARDFLHAKEVRLTLSSTPPAPLVSQAARRQQAPPRAKASSAASTPEVPTRFSLATLCAKLPAQDMTLACTDNTLLIHEDDWRQAEFVSPHFKHEVLQEIADIERLFDQGMIGAKMHLRDRIAAPMMPMSLALNSVHGQYIGARHYDGVAFRGQPHRIDGGFALTTRQGTTLYGIAVEGQVDVLALHGYDPSIKENADFARISELFPPETIFIPWMLIGWTL